MRKSEKIMRKFEEQGLEGVLEETRTSVNMKNEKLVFNAYLPYISRLSGHMLDMLHLKKYSKEIPVNEEIGLVLKYGKDEGLNAYNKGKILYPLDAIKLYLEVYNKKRKDLSSYLGNENNLPSMSFEQATIRFIKDLELCRNLCRNIRSPYEDGEK